MRKHKVYRDGKDRLSQIGCMDDSQQNTGKRPASEYTREFLDRTRRAREDAGMTQEDVATILGINQGLYKTYEVRTPLPHRFVAAFCRATRISERWLFTGQGARKAA
jgi:ribosome-binding protein aMBF1 (putative translation factor)